MTTNKKRLAAFDMDGTLLNDKKEITPKTEKVLKELQKQGVELAFITGRVYVSPYYYAKVHGLNLMIAATNGSHVADENGNMIYEAKLDKETVNKVLDLLKDTGFYFHLYPMDGLITSEENQTNPLSEIKGRMPEGYEDKMRRVILPYEELYNIDDDIYKIIIITDDNEARLKFREFLDKEGIFNSSSWHNNIEITSSKGTKKYGIESMIEKLGITWDDVWAFGDNENDLPMLQLAGHPFIMGNATDEIKKASKATVVGDNDDEGVANALIKEFNLNC